MTSLNIHQISFARVGTVYFAVIFNHLVEKLALFFILSQYFIEVCCHLTARFAASLTTLKARTVIRAVLKSSRSTQVSTATVRKPLGRRKASNKLIDRGVTKSEIDRCWNVACFGSIRRTSVLVVCKSLYSAVTIANLSLVLMLSENKDKQTRSSIKYHK